MGGAASPPYPAEVDALLAGRDLVPVGVSALGAEVAAVLGDGGDPSLVVAWADAGPAGRGAEALDAEADRLAWLRPRLPCPEPILHVVDGERSWLVSRPVDGMPANHPRWATDASALVVAVATALRHVHSLDPADCPFEAGADALVALAARRVGEGAVDAERLDPAYRRHTPERLLEVVRQAVGALHDEPPVVVHGRPGLAGILLTDDGAPAGVSGVARLGVGDRYVDLASTAAALARHVSPEALGPFFDAYGIDHPSLARVDAFALLAELI